MNDQSEDIKVIRQMMERSSKFSSLNGMVFIIVGLTAILGAVYAWFYIFTEGAGVDSQSNILLLVDALIVVFVSICACFFLCSRRAKKHSQPLFNSVTWRIIYSLSIPLIAGGVFCLTWLFKGDIHAIYAGTLLFYGLALINASKYTYKEIHYLGLAEIILAIVALFLADYGLIIWTVGFGLCHLLFGVIIYLKYDKKE